MKNYNKLCALILLPLISVNLLSQQLTEEFLEGLPESVREGIEVQNEIAEDEELEALFRAETSISKNKIILKKLKDQLSSLETIMNPEELSSSKGELERFGSTFFSSIQSSFMPINVPNIGPSYIVDVGDSFELMMTGKLSKKGITLNVQRDGSLVIPEIGKIFVAGKDLQEVDNLVSNFISEAAIGVKTFLTLSGMRDVQILLLGGVESPGIYTLSGGSSILGALNVAGGISDQGSYRKIEHRRAGKLLQTTDLYDVFVAGEYDIKNTLRSGDTIFVHASSINIPVTGGVANAAIFEALSEDTLADIIRYAGGFSKSFHGFDFVTLQKTSLTDSALVDIPLTEIQNISVEPRDSLLVPYFASSDQHTKSVVLKGMVNRPGSYYIRENESLSDLIQRAGGYKESAYLFGAALMREEAALKQKQFAQMNYADTVNYIISSIGKPGGGGGSGSLDLLAEELRAQRYSGRVILDFNNAGDDVLLNHNDEIVIPGLPSVVYMFGDFKNPANITYTSKLKVKDYLEYAGGLKRSAYDELVIIDPDGKSHIYKTNLLSFSSNIDIYPGSIIYAPRDIGKLSGISYAAAVSPILSSLALSLASLNSISNN
jgi:polysaccharide biosynthesis/export protein